MVVVTLAVMMASCGRSTPEGEKKTPSETAAPTPAGPAPLVVEWSDADMEKNTARIGYGPKPKEIVARNKDGALIFTPETPKDHLATAYTELPPYNGDRSLELSVQAQSPGGAACVANLQDQAFNVLATVPCQTAGEQHASVKVPGTVTGVRIYFQSAKREPIRLPVHMRLSEQR